MAYSEEVAIECQLVRMFHMLFQGFKFEYLLPSCDLFSAYVLPRVMLKRTSAVQTVSTVHAGFQKPAQCM